MLPPASISAVDLFLAVWLFALGGVVGSFLNVVIYRLPRGESLVYPGSRCPRCGHAIRWYDNVPIFGWLFLRGRCRDCGVNISPRYPLVELTLALVFLTLGALEWLATGANLPRAGAIATHEAIGSMRPWISLFAFHAVLVCGLVWAAWMARDREVLPLRLVVLILGIGLIVPLFLPQVRPVGFDGRFNIGVAPPRSLGLLDGLAGLAMGVVLGSLWLAAKVAGVWRDARDVFPSFLWIGGFLGWQAALGVATFAAIVELLRGMLPAKAPRRRAWPAAATVALTTFVWLCAWRWIWNLLA